MLHSIPTDRFGRPMQQTLGHPSLSVNSRGPTIDYEEEFINADGDTFKGTLNMGKHSITNVEDPTNDTDVANKKYIDDLIQKAKSEGTALLKKTLEDLENRITKGTLFMEKKLFRERMTEFCSAGSMNLVIPVASKVPITLMSMMKGYSITKNVILHQILIEGENDKWYDLSSICYRIKGEINEEFIHERHYLYLWPTRPFPKSWSRRVKIVFTLVAEKWH